MDKVKYAIAASIYRLADALLAAAAFLLFRKPSTAPAVVAVLRTGHLGDTVCAIPAFREIKKRYPPGFKLPGAIDPASRGRSQVDGKNLLQLYRKEGLHLVPADNAVEAGIEAVWSRLSTGRLKIARHLSDFFDEYRLYRRDENGRIVKENDHYMDALRYLVMTGLKIAKPIRTQVVRGAEGRSFF